MLLLLPDSSKKFAAKWQGPYQVMKRVGKVNYKIKRPEKEERKQIFHLNLLKRWHDKPQEVYYVSTIQEDEETP